MAHSPNINNNSNKSNSEISDAERVHNKGDCLSNETLKSKHVVAITDPVINAEGEISVASVGTKNAITTVPTRIFEISAKYFERVEI